MASVEKTLRNLFSRPKCHRHETKACTSTVPDRPRDKGFWNFHESREVEDCDKAIELLDAYFSPKKNIDYEVFQFPQAKQLFDKAFDQFCLRL